MKNISVRILSSVVLVAASVSAVLLSTPSFANVFSSGKSSVERPAKKTIWGTITYGQETIDTVEVNGSVDLNGTRVVHNVDVTGKVHAKNASIGKLHVIGNANLEDSLIQERAEINGRLKGDKTVFQKEVVCDAVKIDLQHCQLPSLTVLKVPGYPGEQTVKISDNTIVTGPIIFESNHGKVIASSDSMVNEVRGGTLIRN